LLSELRAAAVSPSPSGLRWAGVEEFLWEQKSLSRAMCRTMLWLLAPGVLTRRFMRGATIGLVSPMKLYLVAFGWMTFVVGGLLDQATAGFPRDDGLATMVEWAGLGLSFLVPVITMASLRGIWGQRPGHYAFALHTTAFMGFFGFLLSGVVWPLVFIWICANAWLVYGAERKGYSLQGAILRSMATGVLTFATFTLVLLMQGILSVIPSWLPAWARSHG
jgi:hypothetical protein